MGTFVDEVVQCHNLVRTKHGVKELKLNADLTAHAQKWADKLASSGKFEHSNCDFSGENVGENIAMAWKPGGQTLSGKEACDMWYSEISKYDYNKAGFSSGTAIFQLHDGGLYITESLPDNPVINIMSIDPRKWDTMTCINQVSAKSRLSRQAYGLLKMKSNPGLFLGHFTQMVWKGSNELGVGIAKGDDGKIYVVANYLPPGNYTGQFQDNVFPPK